MAARDALRRSAPRRAGGLSGADAAEPVIILVASDLGPAWSIVESLEAGGLPARMRLEDEAEVPPDVDLVIVVLDGEEGVGLDRLRALRERLDEVPLVAVAPDGSERRMVRSALRARVDGLVLAAQVHRALVPTVHAVLAGLTVVPRRERTMLSPALSHRERQVLALVALGNANSQVASRLFLSESTVKSHLTSAFAKLGVASRGEAAALILDPEEPIGRTILCALDTDVRIDEELPTWP